jgi:hypothetical protein
MILYKGIINERISRFISKVVDFIQLTIRRNKMKIIPIQLEISYDRGYQDKTLFGKWSIFCLNIGLFDWCDGETSLFEIGWYQGDFVFELLYSNLIKWQIIKWRDNYGQ